MNTKTIVITVAALLVLGSTALVTAVFTTGLLRADLRPDGMGAQGTGARAMGNIANRHGGAQRWMDLEQVTVILEGEWGDPVPHEKMGPFLSDKPRIKMTFSPASHGEAVIQVLDGEQERFEVRAGQPIQHTDSGETAGPEELKLFIRAIRHLIEMPFAMTGADVQRSVPNADWNGAKYTRLFATWGTAEPQENTDQYIMWQNQQTGLLERFDATGRFVAPFVTARVTFSEHREHSGFFIPQAIEVESTALGSPTPIMTWRIVAFEPKPARPALEVKR